MFNPRHNRVILVEALFHKDSICSNRASWNWFQSIDISSVCVRVLLLARLFSSCTAESLSVIRIPAFVHDPQGRRLETRMWRATATLIAALTHAMKGKLQRMLIVEAKRGPQPGPRTSLLGASGMFVFTHSVKEISPTQFVFKTKQTSTHRKKKKRTIPPTDS